MLDVKYFSQDAQKLARDLLGKLLRVRYQDTWLVARIIETEAYYLEDKGSHASLGYTEKRKALFMPAGTIYMYYARGGDSFNISAKGKGNAVLVKSGYPYLPELTPKVLQLMQKLNPARDGSVRPVARLMAGQTLLCKSLGLRVPDWDAKVFDATRCYVADVGIKPEAIIQTTRLGISAGRDEHLPYRFIDSEFLQFCTKKPKDQSG